MRAESLRRAVDADQAAGHHPFAVVATVGTTSTASVDSVQEIAELCAERGIWLHVDAAYGGAMGAVEEGRWAMEGTEHADSIVVNPHKWLFVPLDFSTLYVRDPELLRSVFALVPDYLAGDTGSSQFPDYMDYSIQLGRRFRALKAWMVFRSFGAKGIASRIREHCRLARFFASLVAGDSAFVLGAPVTMGVVCFRFEPTGLSPLGTDALNEAIVAELNAGGRVFLTHTRLKGKINMRIGLGNLLTTEAHLQEAWGEIARVAKATATGQLASV
jgi:aromatic-L-amino-acid decarboxylase